MASTHMISSWKLAALYDLKLGDNGLLSFYAAPMGDPAIGPTAYPHRASASEDPIATLGHHLEDSTHVADDVITAGLTYKVARLRPPAFMGASPTNSVGTLTPAKSIRGPFARR